MNLQLTPIMFELFQKLLVEESGIFFDPERKGLLLSALADRMATRHVGSAEEYFRFIKSGGSGREEIKALIDLVTVGETYFFRNQPHFDVLRGHLLPRIIEERFSSTKRITIWSAACSTGEEPYSIAMTLLETLPCAGSWDISLLATDVNRDHLKRAREAVYGERAVRAVPTAWLEKYFEKRDGRYHLRNEVKRLVRFEYHNLAPDPYNGPGMQEVDFLFCRNVTIYFTLDATRRVMSRFARCLSPAGHLFIGDAETLWQVSDEFVPVEFPHTFLYQRASGRPRHTVLPVVRLPEPAIITPLAPAHTVELPVVKATAQPAAASRFSCELGWDALRAKHYEMALEQFDRVLQENPRDVEARLGKASILADRDQHEDAIAHLQQVIRHDNLSCEAYYLLGVLHAKMNNLGKAIASFEQAVYVDHTLALVYFSLANIHRAQGRPDKARRQFLNALRAVADESDTELVRFSEDITCGYLRAACHRSLEQLKAQTSLAGVGP
jgi:chemotaxis protein methyltransferase CheR